MFWSVDAYIPFWEETITPSTPKTRGVFRHLMDPTAPFKTSRPLTSITGGAPASHQSVTMPRDIPYKNSHPHPQSTHYEQPQPTAGLRSQVSSQQPALHHASVQPQLHRASNKGHELDCQLVAARMNEFADFLVRFNNTTVRGVETRLQRFETVVEERVQRLEAAERERERRIGEQFDSLCHVVQGAVADGVKVALTEQRERERNTDLMKSVADTISPVLGARLDDVTRRLETNEATVKALQSSLESHLKLLETRSQPSSVASNTIIPSPDPLSSPSIFLASSSNSAATKSSALQFEEYGFMLDRLAQLVDAARDEAHADKEDLALLFNDTHRNLAFTLHDELLALKNAVGAGKCYLKVSKDDNASTKPFSLAERLEYLAMDFQEAMEYFKDAEAARDSGSSSELKSILEMLSSFRKTSCGPTKILSDAGVMTDDQGLTTESKDVSEMSSDRAGANAVSPQKSFNEAEFMESFTTVGTSNLDPVPEDESFSGNTSAATLVDGPFSTDIVDRNQTSFPSYLAPLLDQSPHSALFSEVRLGLGIETDETLEKYSSSTALQLSGVHAPFDPSKTLISPLSSDSSTSRSPRVALKRKAISNAVEAKDSLYQPSADPTCISASNSGDIGFVFDLDKSPSPLTSLASEDEEDSSDDDDYGDLPELDPEEKMASRFIASPSSSPSIPLISLVGGKARAQKQEVVRLLKHWCPNKCGRGYIHKSSLYVHQKRGCTRTQESCQTINPSSAGSAKRRKLGHEAGGSPTSAHSSGSKQRGKPPKAEAGAVAPVHPPEALKQCDWPTKSVVAEKFGHQLLQCDRCDLHFHYRCVGVTEGDARLVPEAAFVCPPCSFINDPQSAVKGNANSPCSRPDCDWPGQASNALEDYFIVEKIIGRSVADLKDVGSTERVHLWLIKWLGYPLKECDWLVKDGLPNADELINQFYVAAAAEKLELRDDDSIYLLREVRNKLHMAVRKKWKWT